MWPALIPLAAKLIELLVSKTEPTEADWDTLKLLADKDSARYLADAQLRLDAANAKRAAAPKILPTRPA